MKNISQFAVTCYLYLLIILSSFIASAQSAEVSASTFIPLEAGQYPIENFSPQDYIGHPQNWAVLQHPNGRIYASNTSDTMVFDGVSWRRIEHNGSPVLSMDLAPDGRIFVGQVGQIGYLEANTLGDMQYHSLMEALPTDMHDFTQVWRTWVQEDAVYFGAQERILRYDNDGFRQWLPERTAFHLLFVLDDQVFVRETGIGLKHMVNDEFQLVPDGERFADSRIDAILPREDGQFVVVAGFEGFFVHDGEHFQSWGEGASSGAASAFIYSAIRLDDGRIATATVSDGIHLFDEHGRHVNHINREAGLLANAVNHLTLDRQGGLWAALDGGLARIDISNPMTVHGPNNGLDGMVTMIHRQDSTLYAGTGSGLFRLEAGPRARWHRVEGIQSQTWAMLQHGEQLLIANHQGVFALEEDSENAKGVLQVGAPVFVLKASDSIPNRVYLGTQNGLTAMEYDGENWQPLEFADALPFPIRSMVNAPDGYTWLGTDFSGVIRLQLDDSLFPSIPDWTRFAEPEGFTSTFQLEPTLIDGKLYIARSDSLYELAESGDRVKITRDFGSFFPQVETSIWNAHKDNSGRLWIHRFENNPRRSELGFAVEIDGDYQWQSPSYLRALDNHHLPTFYADDSGILWYGGAPGLFRINPEATPPEEYQYSLRLRDIRDSEDQSLLALLAEEGALTVPYADNRLRFEFAAPSHVQREAIRYQVRLDGLDSNWSPWFEEPSMTYTGLREGSYQFQVRARDAQGNISATTAIDFRILAPWYRSVWAYLVFGLVALFTGRALLRWRFSRLETQKRELEQQVHERTQQLEEAMVTDQLTGLHNRRYLERFLEQDLAGVHRLFDDWQKSGAAAPAPHGHIFYLIDIDYFKTVNDTRGHSAGDRVLEQMGNLLKSIFRPPDHLVRWGGEEFLVIARHLPGDQAVQMAERVRQTVAEHIFEVDQDACVRLSCSIGYAPYPPLADAPQTVNWLRLVDLADACLYTAKSNGRNQHVGIVPGTSTMTIDELETMLSDPPRLTPVPGIEVVRSTG